MTEITRRFLTAANWVYFTLLFGWLVAYLVSGDRIGWISMVNMLAVYLFTPLPLAILGAFYLRRAEIWAGSALGLVAFVWLWGGLFLPKAQPAIAHASAQQSLTVMTYNALGYLKITQPQIAVIRAENADLVLIQELSPRLAEAIVDELSREYPFQVLDPQETVYGMGVISKYPLRPAGESLPLEWVGTPQVLEVDWQGQALTVVNFHMIPTTSGTMLRISDDNRYRELEARTLVELAQRSGAAILAGDANATPLSDAYRILAADLGDAWAQAGYGFGHTFPGSDSPFSARPRIAGIPAPQWLVRIDYIFQTGHWQVMSAHVAAFDGVSDHRGVVARLSLRAQP